jgi:hypothetical protein
VPTGDEDPKEKGAFGPLLLVNNHSPPRFRGRGRGWGSFIIPFRTLLRRFGDASRLLWGTTADLPRPEVATVGSPEEGRQHLFILRIWTEPAGPPIRLSRGLIEHIPSGERQYFVDLADVQGFVSRQLSLPPSVEGAKDGP